VARLEIRYSPCLDPAGRLKNAAAGLPRGGGRSVIFADPKMPLRVKERLIRAFAAAIADVTE